MDMTMGPMMGWMWMLTWFLLLAALVAGIVFLVRALTVRAAQDTSSAIGILEQRFARGEIDGEEFEQRKRTLQS